MRRCAEQAKFNKVKREWVAMERRVLLVRHGQSLSPGKICMVSVL